MIAAFCLVSLRMFNYYVLLYVQKAVGVIFLRTDLVLSIHPPGRYQPARSKGVYHKLLCEYTHPVKAQRKMIKNNVKIFFMKTTGSP